ncbi:uncharacterized protein T551_01492 [Pneumocystis jirovecii RU7]|uniref:Rho-GAP domain-containing protein n=1 Tax=Pneumocystis jirovecii (strain RU7) TaxID=1408657 RepID=A0A0W4ZRB7_PNEJ7|nr:uncharacterized protein T551_01492 [Pneumocystis jirovecii RU7]KTW30940.1 hypothetical protein T551_01492 [Pneumocystis jirovecii RU7]
MKSNKKEKKHIKTKCVSRDLSNISLPQNVSKNNKEFDNLSSYSRMLEKTHGFHIYNWMKRNSTGQPLNSPRNSSGSDMSFDLPFSGNNFHFPISQSLNDFNITLSNREVASNTLEMFLRKHVPVQKDNHDIFLKKKSVQYTELNNQNKHIESLTNKTKHKGWMTRRMETDRKFSGFSKSHSSWKLYMTVLSGSKLYFYIPSQEAYVMALESSHSPLNSSKNSALIEYTFSPSEFDLNVRSILYDANNLQRYFFGTVLTEFGSYLQGFERNMNSIFLSANAIILCYRGTSLTNNDQGLPYNLNICDIDLKNLWKLDIVYNIYDIKISFSLLKDQESNLSKIYDKNVYLMVISNQKFLRRFILSKKQVLSFLHKYILLLETLKKKVEFSVLENTLPMKLDYELPSSIMDATEDILFDSDGTLKGVAIKEMLKIMLGATNVKTSLDVLDLFSTTVGFWGSFEIILKTALSIVSEIPENFTSNIEKMINIWCDRCCSLFQDDVFVNYIEELIKNGVDSRNIVLGEILKNKVKNTVLTVRENLFNLITIDISAYMVYDDTSESGLFTNVILEIPPEVFSRELYCFHKYCLNIWDPSSDLSLFFNKTLFNLIRNPLVFGPYNIHFVTRLIFDQLLRTNDKMSPEFRARICTYWISVSMHLKNYGDMAGWLSIIIALCSPSIVRLKKLWSLVSSDLRSFIDNCAPIMNHLQICSLYIDDEVITIPDILILCNQYNFEISTLTIPYYGEVLNCIETSKFFLNFYNKIVDVKLCNDVFVSVKKKLENWKNTISTNKTLYNYNDKDRNTRLQEIFKQLNCIKSNPQSIFSDIFFKKSIKCEPLHRGLYLQRDYPQNMHIKINVFASLIFNYIYISYNLLDFKDLFEVYKNQNTSINIKNRSSIKDSFSHDTSFQVSNPKDIYKHWRRNSFPFNKYSIFTTHNRTPDSKPQHKVVNSKNKVPVMFQNVRDILEANQTLFYYTDGQLILRSTYNISKKIKPGGRIKISKNGNNMSKISENEKLDNRAESAQKMLCQVVVKAGSLDRLVDVLVLGIDDFSGRLIHEPGDIQVDLYINLERFRLTFFSTFRSFCAPSTLLEYFRKRLIGSKTVASQIGVDMKVSEYVKNNETFPDWNLLNVNNNLLNYDFYLKIHVGVLKCMVLWLSNYFCDFIDNLDALNGFYSFCKSANDQLQSWKEIVLAKNELEQHMTQYLDLFKKVTDLFIKSSYRPQTELLHIVPINILKEIDVSGSYSDEGVLDLAYTLDKLAASLFTKLKLEDWIYCSELLEIQSRDINSFFEFQQSISLENDYMLHDIYSLLSQIRRTQTHDLLINVLPLPIKQLFKLRHSIIEWVVSQVTDINIDCSTRTDRILLYLRLLSVYQLTGARLDFFFGPFDGINWARNKYLLPSFVGNAIATALVRSESRLFTYAWSIIASKRGLNGQVEDLVSVIPQVTINKSCSFTPCIGWVFEHLLKIVFYIPNVVGNSQHINFIKQIFIYDFILHIINTSNSMTLKTDQKEECNDTSDSILNIQVHDIRTLEMVSENENYPLRFSNIEKPFQSLIQKKMTMIEKNQKHYEDIKKYFRGIEKDDEQKNINNKQVHKEVCRKVLSKTKNKSTNLLKSALPIVSAFTNNFSSDKISNISTVLSPELSSGFSTTPAPKPSDIVDLIDSSVSSLEISKSEYMFKIKSKNGMKMLLRAPSPNEHKIWYQKFKDLSIITITRKKNVLTKNMPAELANAIAAKKASANLNSNACYGVDLAILCSRENNSIPKILNDLINEIESRGLDEVGIYRVPGSIVSVNALKALLNSGEAVNLKDDRWADVNIIAGALKLWLRELPEPLMTYKLYPQFIDLSDIPDYHKRITVLKELIQKLPLYNYFLIKRLVEHFEK